MNAIKDFLESYSDDYYALPPEERFAVNVITVLNVVGTVALVGWMIRDRRRRKAEVQKNLREEKIRQEHHEKTLSVLRKWNDDMLQAQRSKMSKIVDEAHNPSSEALEDLRRKLADPNYVWEL